MSEEYYGPTIAAVAKLNNLLDLPATGREQDWEVEFADPAKLGEILGLLSRADFNEEERCALFVLALHSLDEAAESGVKVNLAAAALRNFLTRTPSILEKMRFYWGRLSPESATAFVLH